MCSSLPSSFAATSNISAPSSKKNHPPPLSRPLHAIPVSYLCDLFRI
ncbi:hypothetical protein LINGRAHAP2_LOCUS29598 [Linum grandiflorum]